MYFKQERAILNPTPSLAAVATSNISSMPATDTSQMVIPWQTPVLGYFAELTRFLKVHFR